MLKHADVTLDADTLRVEGDLDFSNVMSVYEKALPLLKNSPAFVFDFSRVTSSSSAGLALIVEWIKLSRQQQKSCQFKHLSKDILSIAKASGLDELIQY